jgi:Arc/MetJ-type ribon-helix-helix transcriptional regulator
MPKSRYRQEKLERISVWLYRNDIDEIDVLINQLKEFRTRSDFVREATHDYLKLRGDTEGRVLLLLRRNDLEFLRELEARGEITSIVMELQHAIRKHIEFLLREHELREAYLREIDARAALKRKVYHK